MRARAAASVVLAAVASSGCWAMKPLEAQPALSMEAVPAPDRTDLRIAVRPPRTRASSKLVRILGESGLFSEVGWADEIAAPPAVLVGPIAGPAPKEDFDNVYWAPDADRDPLMFTLTLGVYPMIQIVDNGVYFERFDRVAPSIRCKSPARLVFGWAALLLLPFPSWHWPLDEDRAYPERMKRCLADNLDVLRGTPP